MLTLCKWTLLKKLLKFQWNFTEMSVFFTEAQNYRNFNEISVTPLPKVKFQWNFTDISVGTEISLKFQWNFNELYEEIKVWWNYVFDRSWSSHHIIIWNFGGQTILIVHDLLFQTNACIDIYNWLFISLNMVYMRLSFLLHHTLSQLVWHTFHIIINWQPTPEYFMFRLVATFQECCLKALNSRERFFKVTNVLVIERSVDWRLPFRLFSAFTEISSCLSHQLSTPINHQLQH